MSEDLQKLFTKYNLSKEQIDLFQELRKEFTIDYLDNTKLIMVICSKKTFKKSKKSIKVYHDLISKYETNEINNSEMGKYYKEDKDFRRFVKNECIFWESSIRTIDDEGIIFMNGGNWIPAKKEERYGEMRGFLKLVECFLLEHPSNVTNGIILVGDLSTLGWKNFDFQLEKVFANMLQSIPCRVKKMIVSESPWYISLIWNILKPFYSKKLRSRFSVFTKKQTLDYLGAFKLPFSMGGKIEMNYSNFLKKTFGIEDYQSKVEKAKARESLDKEKIVEIMKKQDVDVTVKGLEDLKEKVMKEKGDEKKVVELDKPEEVPDIFIE